MSISALLVEDNVKIRESLIELLDELTPVRVVAVAETEWEARRWLSESDVPWRLAIVDIFLKGGSGLSVLAMLTNRDPRFKVFVLSNYATPDIRAECLRLGADAFFDKSSDTDLLIQCCRQLSDEPDSEIVE